jgi:hypothetical protein
VILREDGIRKHFSAVSLVRGYDALFDKAVQTKGSLEPFIQQLSRYDDRDVNTYRGWITVSESVAVKVLSTGVMSGKSSDEIRNTISIFLEPSAGTQDHGRAISAKEAKECSLAVDQIDLKSELWKTIYGLYYRADTYVSTRASKLFESADDMWYESRPKRKT